MKGFIVALYIISQLIYRCNSVNPNKRYAIDMWRNQSTGNQSRVIRIATSASLYWKDTYARYGRDMVRGWDMFAQWLNVERGGIQLNGSAYSIAFDMIEDYSDKALITEIYKSLLNDFNLFFGPYSSGLTVNAVDVTDPAGKFLLATGATFTAVFKGRKSSFTTLPPNLAYIDSSFAAFSSYGAKTTAVLKDTDFTGCGTPQESNASATSYGLTLYKQYDLNPLSPYYSQNVSDIIADLKKKGVETIVACTYLPLCYEVCKSWLSYSFSKRFSLNIFCACNLHQFMNSSMIQDYNAHAIVFTFCLDSAEFMSWAGKVSNRSPTCLISCIPFIISGSFACTPLILHRTHEVS